MTLTAQPARKPPMRRLVKWGNVLPRGGAVTARQPISGSHSCRRRCAGCMLGSAIESGAANLSDELEIQRLTRSRQDSMSNSYRSPWILTRCRSTRPFVRIDLPAYRSTAAPWCSAPRARSVLRRCFRRRTVSLWTARPALRWRAAEALPLPGPRRRSPSPQRYRV